MSKSISVRNIPDETYETLVQVAKKNKRSLQQQICFILEKEASLNQDGFLSSSKKWREKLLKRKWPSKVVDDIRSDRDSR